MGDEAGVRLLVWDEPELHRGASVVSVGEVADPAVDVTATYPWLADRCGPGERTEAYVCLTVEPGDEAPAASRVTALRRQGFGVHVQPPAPGASSLHAAVAAIIDTVSAGSGLAEVVIASHDAEGLHGVLESLAGRAVPVTMLCFRELAGTLVGRSGVTVIDPETVPGLCPQPLPRTNLYDLPPTGRTLPPLQRPDWAPVASPGAATGADTGRTVTELVTAPVSGADAVAPEPVVDEPSGPADSGPTDAGPTDADGTTAPSAPPSAPDIDLRTPVAPRKPVAPWQTVPAASGSNGSGGPANRLSPPPAG